MPIIVVAAKRRPPNTERATAPIHRQSLARAMGSAAQWLAVALDLTGAEADHRWRELAGHLTHLGDHPNWRNRPSILDPLRGWRITPGPGAQSQNGIGGSGTGHPWPPITD